MRKPNTVCKICGKGIYRRPSVINDKASFYCSLKCCGISQRGEPRSCPVCNVEFHAPPKSQKVSCSRACSNKRRAGIKYKQGAEGDKAKFISRIKIKLAETRGGCCEKCKNKNFAILHVHHIVERANGGTDEPDNLLLVCPNCHAEEHYGSFTYDEFCSNISTS